MLITQQLRYNEKQNKNITCKRNMLWKLLTIQKIPEISAAENYLVYWRIYDLGQ